MNFQSASQNDRKKRFTIFNTGKFFQAVRLKLCRRRRSLSFLRYRATTRPASISVVPCFSTIRSQDRCYDHIKGHGYFFSRLANPLSVPCGAIWIKRRNKLLNMNLKRYLRAVPM